jgi:hypothetical protein
MNTYAFSYTFEGITIITNITGDDLKQAIKNFDMTIGKVKGVEITNINLVTT